eukprot:gene14530-14325_t
MRKAAIVGMVAVLMIGATGFGTIRGLGQNAEHERITRQGMSTDGEPLLQPKTLDELAGKNGTWGAVGAPDNPARGLMASEKNHCDGADWYDEKGYPQSKADAQAKLEACRAYIFDHLNEAVRDAGALAVKDANGRRAPQAAQMPTTGETCTYLGQKGRAKCNVLEDMGLALHAAQDFYSHSNWGDMPNAADPVGRHNPPGLGNTGVADWLDPGKPDTAFPDGLITGCYEGFPEWNYCDYGVFKSRVKHAYLNKDGAGKDRAKINGNYDKVFNLAAEDTWRKWSWLESQIMATYPPGQANAIICGLRKDSASSCS